MLVLHQLEEKIDYERLTIRGIDLWPLIRTTIGFHLHHSIIPKNRQNDGTSGTKIKVETHSRFLDPVRRIYHLLKDQVKSFSDILELQKRETDNFKFKIETKGGFWVVGFNHHRTRNNVAGVDGYNQFSDPITEILYKGNISYTNIDLFFDSANLIKPEKGTPFLFGQNTLYWNRLFLFGIKNKTTALITLVLDTIRPLVPDCNEEKLGLELEKSISEFFVALNRWKTLLRKNAPVAITTYCFYTPLLYALNHAARKYNIPVIEFQHSLLSDVHFAWGKWGKTPSGGYSIFPSHFWLWRKSDCNLIHNNFNLGTSLYQTIHGPNLWLRNWVDKRIIPPKIQDETRVLVCLQGLGIPGMILDAIRVLPVSIKWYLRVHPRYPFENDICQELERKNPNVFFTEANLPNIYSVFQKTDYNITFFSGTAIEAQEFGIQNLIIGEEGKVIFKNHLEAGAFLYLNSLEDLITILKNHVKTNKTFNPIMTTQANPLALLKKVIER